MDQSAHIDCPAVDTNRTLVELTGVDWGPPPTDARIVLQERHETRRKRLGDWTHQELIRFLRMPCDLEVLVPVAIARLREGPLAFGSKRAPEGVSSTT